MAFDRLIEGIARLQNPTVAGLDPKLDYVPASIKQACFDKYGKTLEGKEIDWSIEAAEKGGAKSAREMAKLVDEVVGMFAGGTLPKEDRDAYMAAISKAYFESTQENKKYTPKKHRK